MNNLIAKVAELRELAIRAKKVERINEEKNTRSVDTEYAVKSYLASFDMLDVLSGFQAGDADEIAWIIKNYGFTLRDHTDMLHRYRDMARLMEGNP